MLGDDGTAAHDAAHTFEFYQDKAIDELPDESGDAAGVGDTDGRPVQCTTRIIARARLGLKDMNRTLDAVE